MATNVFVRNMFLDVPNPADNRRLEVVVDELPLFGGVQFAVDTTLVSAVQGDGVPRRGAANRDGVALASARRRKARTYPELVEAGAQHIREAIGGGEGTVETSIGATTHGASMEAPMEFHVGVCSSTLFCLISSRFEGWPRCRWPGEAPPSHEVECDFHHAGLCG